jgi:protein TonB
MNSTIQTNSMHEMLFEKRNKDYGAYVIRGSYNDTVLKSLIMVASALLLFIGGTYAYNNFFAKTTTAEETLRDTGVIETIVNLNPLDPTKPLEVPKSTYTPKTAAIAMIIKDKPEENPDQKDLPLAPVASKGTEGDTTDADPVIGDPKGTGTLAVVTTATTVTTPVLIADDMPEYIGGSKAMVEFISRNIVYPERAKLMGTEGTVFVNFVVDADGKVSKCRILKGISDDCNEEALRVVAKMPVWKPGKNAGVPVPVMFNLPIKFKLN